MSSINNNTVNCYTSTDHYRSFSVELIRRPDISDTAVRLYQRLRTNKPGYINSPAGYMHQYGWSKDKLYAALKVLIKEGYVTRVNIRYCHDKKGLAATHYTTYQIPIMHNQDITIYLDREPLKKSNDEYCEKDKRSLVTLAVLSLDDYPENHYPENHDPDNRTQSIYQLKEDINKSNNIYSVTNDNLGNRDSNKNTVDNSHGQHEIAAVRVPPGDYIKKDTCLPVIEEKIPEKTAKRQKRQMKPQWFKDFYNEYPERRRGGNNTQAWNVVKNMGITDEQGCKILDDVINRKKNDSEWKQGFINGITNYLRQEIWKTPIAGESNQPSVYETAKSMYQDILDEENTSQDNATHPDLFNT